VVTGPQSIDLLLTDIDVSLPAAFAHQAGRMLSPASFDDPTIDQHPVSAGPYRVTQYLAGDQIQMERFEDYWDAESMEGAPKHFVYRIMPDASARLAALRTGQIDATSLAPSQVSEAQDAGLDVHDNPGLGYYVIWLNSSREQFQDVRVRQAMNIAIDREAITQSVLFGHGIPTVQPFPPGYFAHNPDFPVDHYGYDPERARELLAEAGVPDGISFEFMAFQLSPHYDIAQAVQAYWAEVGIDATIRIVETAQVAVLFFGEKQSDVMLSTLGARPDPSMTIGYQFTSAGFGNPGGQSTPAIEELYVESLREADPERRAEILQENVAEVVEQAFQVPIAAATYNYALSEDITGFVGRAEGYIDLRDLRKLAD
jgi:peptide/nickel transport system substrate-binding protein